MIDVDHRDGLDDVGRVNAGIDIMLNAAGDQDLRHGNRGGHPVGTRRVAWSNRIGHRRQIRLFADDEAIAKYLSGTGEIDRYSSVLVVDCGDSGMSMYTVARQRCAPGRPCVPRAISGRSIDKAIARSVTGRTGHRRRPGVRSGLRDVISACRTAKRIRPSRHTAQGQIRTSPWGRQGRRNRGHGRRCGRTDGCAGRRAVADAPWPSRRRWGADPEAVVPGRRACEHSGGTDDRDPPREQSRGDPAMPELASAVGAARLAAARAGASRQTVIGGGITRGLLSRCRWR